MRIDAGWEKLNRDYTVYVQDAAVAALFRAVFMGDSDFNRTFRKFCGKVCLERKKQILVH